MKKNITNILLIVIIVLALTLRLWQLASVPASLDWDEAALGYNAHALFTTGKDEYGVLLPPILRSYNDYKPAAYAYLAIPTIEIFGRNAIGVRLPSVIFGVLGILALYYLAKELFGTYKENKKFVEIIALLSAFFLAVSPWHIQFSRAAFETNVGLTFNLFIALFFLKGLKRPWLLLVSAFLMGLNISVYQSERVFTPLLVLALVIIYRKALFAVKKKYIVSAVIIGFMLLVSPFLYILNNPDALSRVQNTSIFSAKSVDIKRSINLLADATVQNDRLGKFFDNRRIVYTNEIISGYLSHFNPNWLFLLGDNNRHHAPFMGLLYLFSLPLILSGIYQLLFSRSISPSTKWLVFMWFFLAPIPASVTNDVPHAVRTLNSVPIYQIFTAVGLIFLYEYLHKFKIIGKTLFVAFMVLALFNIMYFLNSYFVQLNYFYVMDWQFGNKEAAQIVAPIHNNYKKVIVANGGQMNESYMFFLFYLDYPPKKYQATIMPNGNFREDNAFDNYQFQRINWWVNKKHKDYLFVGEPSDFPSYIVAKKTIYYPNGKPAILIVDPKENI